MSNNSHNEKEFVYNYYEQLVDSYKKDQSILVAHCGELSQTVISQLEENVETRVSELEIPKGPLKKIFFISVETLQNMLLHGKKTHDGEQYNFFILSKVDEKINVASANLIDNDFVEPLIEQINLINSFEDEKALKKYYLEHLENNTMSEKGGAGLGFITIGMKSGNKLKVDFKQVNDQVSLFTLISSVSLS